LHPDLPFDFYLEMLAAIKADSPSLHLKAFTAVEVDYFAKLTNQSITNVIGELRDLETISLAMTAAETGHFVLATLHTANAVRTVNRMIGAFPSNEQDQVRAMLSESLRAVISQRLVPTADGKGRIPALETLVINRAIGNLIRDEKTVQIRSSMQTGKNHGMYLLEQTLNEMVQSGKITREVALDVAEEKKLITAGA
jgi:twitching motility protein PilT